jgi:hypothetical protein
MIRAHFMFSRWCEAPKKIVNRLSCPSLMTSHAWEIQMTEISLICKFSVSVSVIFLDFDKEGATRQRAFHIWLAHGAGCVWFCVGGCCGGADITRGRGWGARRALYSCNYTGGGWRDELNRQRRGQIFSPSAGTWLYKSGPRVFSHSLRVASACVCARDDDL